MAKQYYCFLERFNNYFNRKLIRKETLEDYQDASEDSFIPIEANGNMTPFDFNPNDNITTEIIANNVPFDPDYFLLLDADENIVSRWFVLEQKRNRQGQWLYFLRRDVLADSYDQLSNAPLFVEKGIISDIDSPLLLNNEDVRVNQIKKSEYLLKDSTRIAWLVLYLKKGALGNSTIGPNGNGKLTIDVNQNDDFVYQTLTTPITSWGYYQYLSTDYLVTNVIKFTINYGYIDLFDIYYSKLNFWSNSTNYTDQGVSGGLPTNLGTDISTATLASAFIAERSQLTNKANNDLGYNSTNPLLVYDGKIIKDSQGKYFKVRVFVNSSGTKNVKLTNSETPTLKIGMNDIWNSVTGQSITANNDAFSISLTYEGWRISLEELPNYQTVVDFGAYTGDGTRDSALFDAICMPYGPCWILKGGSSLPDQANKERSLSIMRSITTQLTSEWVLDLQLLPYFPIRSLPHGANNIHFPADPSGTALICEYNGNVTDLIGICDESNFSLDIWATSNGNVLNLEDDSDVPQTFKRKYVNDCTIIRLCSPNYNGVFEFNLAKNGGDIHDFNIDITLRPYNPYIHANPNFKFLYGNDFNDARGLICGGDFSLGIINDAWNAYEIQNKNYQAIFDRQIQNLDINNSIARQEAMFGAVAGTVQGTASGAVTGGVASGSPYGAIAGAIVGGVASGVGGALDLANLQKRQQEQRNYAIDNYNLQLGNVRALPNSITKTSALTFNNKIFLFYEIYECSEEEKQAYYNKIKYNGMTVGKIDTIGQYKSLNNSNYFRAKLIRMTDISEDNHYVETINEELLKGVFI